MDLKDKITNLIFNDLPVWSLDEEEDIDALVEKFEDNIVTYERLIIILEDVIKEIARKKKLDLSRFIDILENKSDNKK